MTFSSYVKNELASNEPPLACCRHAMCYGMLLFGKSFSKRSISFLAENKKIIDIYLSLLFDQTGIEPEVSITKGNKYKISITDPLLTDKILDAFYCSPTDIKKRINLGNLQNLSTEDEIYNCCNRAFLRGAFLACGSMTDPEKNYHLEFVVPYRQLSLDLQALLKDSDIPSGIADRRGVNIIYIKDSTDIENLLNIMGATMSELRFIDVKVHKSVINKVNRENNFEIANISRTATAAADHLSVIEVIRRNGTFDLLSDDLKHLCEVRLSNPDASLSDLSEMFDPPLSRSAVNYRFKKLKAFSKKSREEILASIENSEVI